MSTGQTPEVRGTDFPLHLLLLLLLLHLLARRVTFNFQCWRGPSSAQTRFQFSSSEHWAATIFNQPQLGLAWLGKVSLQHLLKRGTFETDNFHRVRNQVAIQNKTSHIWKLALEKQLMITCSMWAPRWDSRLYYCSASIQYISYQSPQAHRVNISNINRNIFCKLNFSQAKAEASSSFTILHLSCLCIIVITFYVQ